MLIRQSLASTTALLGAGILSAGLLSVSVHAQPQDDNTYTVPRTAYGAPDLQGVWRNATVTPLTRPRELGEQQAYTREEAFQLERAAQMAVEQDNEPLDPNRPPPPAQDLPPVGNYDLFWTDRGMFMPTIDGEYRTSIIIDLPDGQMPGYTDEFLAQRARERETGPDPFDGPEGRGVGERCLLSFGSNSGPPMLPVMYNNNYQIVQTEDYVMILAEMIHDARIIRIDDEPMPHMQKWMGDSVAHWEDDTLVVTTTGYHPQHTVFGASENLTVTERFERVSSSEIVYTFTVEDPTVFSQPWTGELMFNAKSADEPMYEYACHEGNYALPGVLAGARRAEAEASSR